MRGIIQRIKENKKLFVVAICVLVTVILACTACIVFTFSKLITNDNKEDIVFSYNFDEGIGDFIRDAWEPDNSVFGHCVSDGIDGSGCVMVSNIDANDARYQIDIDVEEDTYYRISGWIKTEDIENNGDAAGANISVLKNFERYEYIYGTTDWTHVEVYGKTDHNQTQMTVALRVGFYSGDNIGTAWFDDLEITRLSKLPAGVSAVSFADMLTGTTSESENQEDFLDEYDYYDITKFVVILTTVIFLAFVIAYRFARAYDGFGRKTPLIPPRGEHISLEKGVLFIFMAGLIIRVIFAFTSIQCSVDVNIFKYWGNMSLSGGFTNTYITLSESIDYPPLYVYVLYLAAAVRNAFGFLGEYNEIFYSFLIKLTPILADCIIGIFVYRICDNKMKNEWILLVVAAWMLNPAVIIDSACWGQVDSVLALFVLLGVYFSVNKKYLQSGLMLGLGLMLKPQAFIVYPIVFFVLFKEFVKSKDFIGSRFIPVLKTFCGWLVGAVVPCLPFMFKMGMTEIEFFGKTVNVPWILSLFIGTANHYAYATVNALNSWFILGKNWIPDDQMIGPLSIFMWGMIAIVLICVFIWIVYMIDEQQPFMPYFLSATLYMGVSMFSSRMHERYFFTAIIFLLVAFIMSNNKIIMWLYAAMSAFGFLTIAEVLLNLEVGGALRAVYGDEGYSMYSKFLWVSETPYRMVIAWAMVIISVAMFIAAILFVCLRKKFKAQCFSVWKLDYDEENIDCIDDAPLLSLNYESEVLILSSSDDVIKNITRLTDKENMENE